MKKPKKKTLRNRCDKLFSEAVKERAHHKCEMCDEPGNQPHHIIGRRNLHLRFDLHNGICLCYSCHTFGNNAAHRNPIYFMDWMKSNRPKDLKYLRKEQHKLEPAFNYELCELSLKEYIKNI